jgi:glycerate dehydrogenase
MKIVVLDGFTLNPGDLDWEALTALGELTVYDRTPVAETVARADDAEIVLTNKTVLSREAILSLRKLRCIGVLATGYNVVDVAAANERGIIVTNVPAYGAPSVAQATFALLLEFTNQVGHHAETVRQGRWSASADFCYWDKPLVELSGLTMGIVGYGKIGQAVGRIARAFGMKTLANTRSAKAAEGVAFMDVDSVFARSDVVSLHCPLTPETAKLVNAERIAIMKSTAYLINTGRGGLVDEQALAAALNDGRIAGAGLDVLSVEPPRADNPLLSAKNCIITPHIAWATRAARERLMRIAVENVKAYIEGKARNVVS